MHDRKDHGGVALADQEGKVIHHGGQLMYHLSRHIYFTLGMSKVLHVLTLAFNKLSSQERLQGPTRVMHINTDHLESMSNSLPHPCQLGFSEFLMLLFNPNSVSLNSRACNTQTHTK